MELQSGMRIEMVMLERHGVGDYTSWDGCEYLGGFYNGHKYMLQILEYGTIEYLTEYSGDCEELENYIESEIWRKDKYCKFNNTYFEYNGKIR